MCVAPPFLPLLLVGLGFAPLANPDEGEEGGQSAVRATGASKRELFQDRDGSLPAWCGCCTGDELR